MRLQTALQVLQVLSVLTYSLSPLSPTLPTASTASSAAFMTPRRGSSALPGMSAIGFAVHQITGLLPPRVRCASVKKRSKKNTAPHPMGCGLPSGDVCVPAALRAESEPRPECHSGGSALHAAAEDLHKSNVEIRELGEVEFAPCLLKFGHFRYSFGPSRRSYPP